MSISATSSILSQTAFRIYTPFEYKIKSLCESAAPFLGLPIEIYLEIGDYLDLFSLSHLRATCRFLSGVYEYHQNDRLTDLLLAYIVLERSLGLRGEHRRSDMSLRDQVRKAVGIKGKELVMLPYYLFEDDIKGEDWHTRFLERLMQRRSPEQVRDFMKNNQLWDSWQHMLIALRKAIRYCGPHEEHVGFVRMFAERFYDLQKEGTPKLRFYVMRGASCRGRIHCVKVLKELNYCPAPEKMSESKKQKLLRHSYSNIECFVKPYPLGYDANSMVQVTQYVIETLKAGIDTAAVRSFIEQMDDCYGTFYGDEDPDVKNMARMSVFIEDILAIFIRNGVDLPSLSNSPIDGIFPIHEHHSTWTQKVFAKMGFNLGPFEEGVSGRIHRHWSAVGEDPDYINLLLKLGCSIDQRDQQGNTPLLLALQSVIWRIRWNMRRLRECTPSSGGEVKILPSYWKVKSLADLIKYPWDYSQSQSIKFFLENGADPFAVNLEGETAISLAMVSGCQDIIEDMINHDPKKDRYGSLSPRDVYDKWLEDDAMWTAIVKPGTLSRVDLEKQFDQTNSELWLPTSYPLPESVVELDPHWVPVRLDPLMPVFEEPKPS
ncbi:hypothetical protein BJ508DRAFT_331382 [Ascobolus immersus RN42]|uniref:Uncharacterized protein n=1 Tax=Ascobolus immersus RN42 TaxID=1160509 RepID=A0A3N4HQV5_ASCIM|nr:hypothetical protein BJ508DRAFT_331382 [Ascobolus immersus RN42]